MAARGSKKSKRTTTRSNSTSAPTNNIPSTNKCERLIKIDNLSDANNNDNVVSARASTTNNLTSTFSETGPLMKVVVSPERGPIELLHSTVGAVVIYTDASLIRDGTAGIGIFFGKDHPLNTTQRLPGKHKQVGWAEIIAATVALQKLRGWSHYKSEPVIIRTDHLMIVEAMQINQITKTTHPKFFVELQSLKKIAQDFPNGVQFEHVYSHNGEEGNEEADALATKATSQHSLPSPRRARSKPPSRRMSQRTRSAYVKSKKSAPPEFHDVEKKKVAKDNDVPFVRLVPTQQYIPPPGAIALRDIKQMEMGVENTQDENSLKEKSASAPSIKIIGVTDVRDENMKDEKTQSENDENQAPRTPKAKTSASRFSSRFGRQPNCRTPSPSRKKEIDGRPITWAPKKKAGIKSPVCSRKDSCSAKDERRIEMAEKLYTAEAIGNHIHDRLEAIKEQEGRKAKIRASIEKKRNEAAEARKREEEEKSSEETSPQETSPTNKKKGRN